MARQGFTGRDGDIYIYQEQITSTAIGLDSTDNDTLKIVASATVGATPTGGNSPIANQATIVIDGSAGGNITITPETAGNLICNNVYLGTAGATVGVVTIDSTGIVGSTAAGGANTVLIGNAGAAPSFSATPTVSQIFITTTDGGIGTSGVNVNYLSGLISGLHIVEFVLVATTADLGATYANGAAGIGATLTNAGVQVALTIDGIALALNDRVLVKNQTNEFENGIYTVTDIGSGATNWVLTRATDYDEPTEIEPGNIVPVREGTVNGGTIWLQVKVVTTIGTDPIVFIQLRIPGGDPFLLKANNLSDLASIPTALTNLGIEPFATQPITQYNTLVGGAGNTIDDVAPGTTGQVLTSNGAAANPSYEDIGTDSGLTQYGLVVAQGAGAFTATNVGLAGQALVSTGGASDPAFNNISLTTGVTGILPIANGGTNASTMATTNGVTYFDGTRMVTVASTGTSGQVLTSNGAAAPSFQASGGGGGSITITPYTTPGTFPHNLQPSTKMVEIYGWGGGGGGGGFPTNTGSLCVPGAHGGAMYYKIPRTFLNSPVTVVVGQGGVGGDFTNFPTAGTPSRVGNMTTGTVSDLPNAMTATVYTESAQLPYCGQLFSSTTPALNSGYLATQNNFASVNPADGTIVRNTKWNGGNGDLYIMGSIAALGTSAGGVLPSGVLPYAMSSGSMLGTPGGYGQTQIASPAEPGVSIVQATCNVPAQATTAPVILAGGIAAISPSTNGGNGNDAYPGAGLGIICGGTGGGGGATNTPGVGVAGNGGNGGFPSGGGGGAGITRDASNTIIGSGTGGTGGNGLVLIIEYA